MNAQSNAAVLLSDSFRACLVAVDTAAAGLGNAVADMLAVGHCEYLTFDAFRDAVKSGLTVRAWDTVTNYMAPMRRAWENKKVSEFCDTARADGIKAALKKFPAGIGKRGAAAPAPAADAAAPVIAPAPSDAETLAAKNDAAIKAAEAELQQQEAAAYVAALEAENARLRAELAAARAELDAFIHAAKRATGRTKKTAELKAA